MMMKNSSFSFSLNFFLLLGCLLLICSQANGNALKKPKKAHQKCMVYHPPGTASPGSGHGRRQKRLAGGTDGDIRAMPWMVYLHITKTRNGITRSGGGTASLISPRYVLTAAHSLTGVTANDSITVFYGASNHTQGTAIVLSNTAAHIHPNYTSIFNAELGIIVSTHDMGVLDLGRDLEFDDNVHSICLACLNDSYPKGGSIIAGWGDQLGTCHPGIPSVYPQVFRYANQSFHPCLTPDFTTADLVCTFANQTISVGGGDSGGPMIAPVGPRGGYMQMCVNGGNICNPAYRENACYKIDGPWLEQLTGVKCKPYVAPATDDDCDQ